MPAITGEEYRNRLKKRQVEIWHNGEKIKNILEHPAFRGIIKSQAALYDLQHKKDMMTYPSPVTGSLVGTSYLQPITREDLIKRRKMIQHWAKMSGGMLGRSPDYMNTVLMTFAASAKLLNGKENCFAEHLTDFYMKAREEDLSFTHTFINPQVNRSQLYFEDSEEPIAAKVVAETKEGIVIKGARLLATQGGITDEILVFSPGGITDQAFAFAFAIPSDTKGLKFISRDSFVGGESTYNYPLSSRFEESDSLVVFDDVVVPWKRVFFYKNIEVSNSFKNASAFVPFTLHQIVSRQIIKTKFMIGLAEAIVNTINISEYPNVQEMMAEMITALETMEALLIKAEANAKIDEFELMRPELIPLQVATSTFPKVYARLSEIVQLLGSSGLVSIPTEADFESEIREDLDQYLQSATLEAKDRVQLFRLAWDATMSAFGNRQTQYERFFLGSPNRLSSELCKQYDFTEHTNYIKNFLK
ncbi:4-hydroxyphenylacetate 3-monooxygenase, oxygenase component [Gracilibacillus salitolerans]|uniref:4-hydroxyphenylacetate 3-monooxygenase, oxygenase component n=1 Tax=Gracilibacillus salitolerans TaxID=2663022 RepID=A0A5Q2TPB9_9BACI|nr:4-hydroxyphenylacetate 3-monooxygenase, oxygenase component [Gracilibacillus salitolerans]QGH35991.1 4-hydroxyphenylacetate 3-monooxygenase, oxygenase component [Gracilibacillus salitolerans]